MLEKKIGDDLLCLFITFVVSPIFWCWFSNSISVIDASFKPKSGILRGNVNWMGNYKECMQTDGLHYCTMANVELNIGLLLVSIKTTSLVYFREYLFLNYFY